MITVCSRAEANCPTFPNASCRLSWAFDDPAAVPGSTEERPNVFRRVRDEIEAKVQAWVQVEA